MQIPAATDNPPAVGALGVEDMAKLDSMSREELIVLVERMARQCGAVACKTEAETAQAMLDTLAHTALMPIVSGLTMKADIQSRLSAIDKWLDRTKGKPAQYIHQVNEHVSKTSAYELTNDQLVIELRKLHTNGLLPEGVMMLEDGTVTIENE